MSREITLHCENDCGPVRSDGRPPADDERSVDHPTRPRATGGFPSVLGSTERTLESADRNFSRAQTSIDFAVGASVFLLTVAFVAAFLPGTFEPFTADGTEDVLVADRTADLLAEQLLAEPTNPGMLNATCTAAFFDDDVEVDDCRFDDAGLNGMLGLDSGTGVHVTVEENGSVLRTYENGTVDPNGGVLLDRGSEPPDDESVVVSRRVVLLGGEERDLYVRLW